jgi:siderophore synthetase component
MGKAHQNQKRKKCTRYLEEDQHYQQKANSSYTKQYSNPYEPMEFSYGGQPPIPTSKSSSAFTIQDSPKEVEYQILKRIRKPH